MWNSFDTGAPDGIDASVITYAAGNGDKIHGYLARPEGKGPFPGVVVVHHVPGWDEFYREFTRRLAQHGYLAFSPDLYCRDGHGKPDDVAAKVRAAGGVADKQVIDDCEAAMKLLKADPSCNGKVGIIGTCSGGRHSVLVASSVKGFSAVVDLWGGQVVMAKEDLNEKRPVAVIDLTKNLDAPILGLFGNDDKFPTPDQVNQHEAELKKHGKNYEFHRYDGAGHGFFYYHNQLYRQEQAMDGWSKVFAFFGKHLG